MAWRVPVLYATVGNTHKIKPRRRSAEQEGQKANNKKSAKSAEKTRMQLMHRNGELPTPICDGTPSARKRYAEVTDRGRGSNFRFSLCDRRAFDILFAAAQ